MSFINELQTFSLNAHIDATENHLKRKTVITPTGSAYEMLNYMKPEPPQEWEVLSEYKSVIFEPNTKYVMCFAPPKSVEIADFMRDFKPTHEIEVEEAVEGTMLNLFYDWRNSKWEIATKGNIGCNYWYFRTEYPNPETGDYNIIPSQKTFRQMFVDVFQYSHDGDYNGYGNDINEIEFLNELPKEYCYSFVLAHPDNHLVFQHQTPKLTLVGVYLRVFRALSGEPCEYVDGKWNEMPSVQVIESERYLSWDCFKAIHCPIAFPSKFNLSSVSDLFHASISSQADTTEIEMKLHTILGFNQTTMGYMIRNRTTGQRMRITNPEYKLLKELRGNNPNLQYQYFCLMKSGKTQDFLKHFPTYKLQFYMFYNQYHTFISRVHQAYVSYYILKMRDAPIPKKYFIHVAKLHHDNYLPSLSQTKKIITHRVVREYFDAMEPQSILYYLNYDFHTHH